MRLASGENWAVQTHQLWPLKVCSGAVGGEVPQEGRVVERAAQQLLAVRRERDAQHAVGVAFERLFELRRLRR